MSSNIKTKKRGFFGKIFWGLLFLVAACFFALKAVGIEIDTNLFLIVVGVILAAVAIRCLIYLEWFGVFLPIALFVTIARDTIEQAFSVDISIWAVWLAAVLLSIGLSIFIRKRPNKNWQGVGCTTFSSTTKRFKAEEIENIHIETRFGAEKIFLEDGQLPKNATIDVDLSLAGIELYVPSNWQIIDNIDKSLGGIEEKNRAVSNKKAQTLTLTGTLSLAGIEITYI